MRYIRTYGNCNLRNMEIRTKSIDQLSLLRSLSVSSVTGVTDRHRVSVDLTILTVITVPGTVTT